MARRTVEVRREEILRVAADVIASQGFADTRVADIAAALGVSTALVFYHFETKDRLLSDAFSYAAARDVERLAMLAASPEAAVDRLRRILTLYGPGPGPGQSWPLWIDAWAAALRMPELQVVSRRLDVHWKNVVAGVIADGVAAGEFACEDPDAAAWRITALLDGLAVQATVHKGVVSRSTMMRWVHEAAAAELGVEPAVLHGVRSPSSSGRSGAAAPRGRSRTR